MANMYCSIESYMIAHCILGCSILEYVRSCVCRPYNGLGLSGLGKGLSEVPPAF